MQTERRGEEALIHGDGALLLHGSYVRPPARIGVIKLMTLATDQGRYPKQRAFPGRDTPVRVSQCPLRVWSKPFGLQRKSRDGTGLRCSEKIRMLLK